MTGLQDLRRQAMDFRRAQARSEKQMIFYVTLDLLESMHQETGDPFDRNEPLKKYQFFCGFKIRVSEHMTCFTQE